MKFNWQDYENYKKQLRLEVVDSKEYEKRVKNFEKLHYRQKNAVSSVTTANINHFIANTAKAYDMSYESVEDYYNRYGSTNEFYEKLEEHIKTRFF